MGGSGNDSTKKCGLTQIIIFLLAIITGTACSICSKVMMQLHSVGKTGHVEVFEKPLFQTFGMFIGMTFGLVMHFVVLICRIPFPGYHQHHGDGKGEEEEGVDSNHKVNNGVELTKSVREEDEEGAGYNDEENGAAAVETDSLLAKPKYGATTTIITSTTDDGTAPELSIMQNTPVWMYFFLAIPSIFDLGATALCMCGLRYLNVSIYQMLRGSGIIFVALMKQNVLGDKLHTFQWIGVFWNVISVLLVGATAMLVSNDSPKENVDTTDGLLGVVLIMAGAFVQALQFVFEEKVMTMDIPAPPLLLIGMEGVWGTLLCLLVVYPIAYYMPGPDHGSYEDPFNTYEMFMNSPTIQWAFFVYFFAIFGYNLFAVLVTFMLSSVWHAILDNFRPITVWGVDMIIFYLIAAGTLGEPWTKWSFIQLAGMFVLLYGTAVYNAPNAGSIQLRGQWYALGIDLTREYNDIERQREEEEMDAKWNEMRQKFKQKRMSSSFMGEMSPHVSIHTQALRGLGSPKI